MTENPMWLVEPPLEEGGDGEEPDEDAAAAPVNPWAELPIAEQLRDVLERLRSEHSYCIFCGCQVNCRSWGVVLPQLSLPSASAPLSVQCEELQKVARRFISTSVFSLRGQHDPMKRQGKPNRPCAESAMHAVCGQRRARRIVSRPSGRGPLRQQPFVGVYLELRAMGDKKLIGAGYLYSTHIQFCMTIFWYYL